MRHALIIAGGSGTRLWPMSRAGLPKQLIPFIGGRSLLQISFDRLEGLTPKERRHVCASQGQEALIRAALPALGREQFLGEPVGRDTLNAVGFAAAVIARQDPEAVIAVITADHLIEPTCEFQAIVKAGFELVEKQPQILVTFGVQPTGPATGFGYLQLGAPIGEGTNARRVSQFREKPDEATALKYFKAGPDQYLWNSGMFVWKAATLLDCIRRYEPQVFDGLKKISEAWETPDRAATLAAVYPALRKISVDFAVMEPASRDSKVAVAAIPMPLQWLDVGSWPSFAQTCPHDAQGNAIAAEKQLLQNTSGSLVASSDPNHLIAVVGCQDLIVIHTSNATLICHASQAERIKEMQAKAGAQFGSQYV
jgi:mannose-1-phosphate guanylyltransferase